MNCSVELTVLVLPVCAAVKLQTEADTVVPGDRYDTEIEVGDWWIQGVGHYGILVSVPS